MTAAPGLLHKVMFRLFGIRASGWSLSASTSTWSTAKRMAATTHAVDSSHAPMLSHPDLVIDVIRAASIAVQGVSTARPEAHRGDGLLAPSHPRPRGTFMEVRKINVQWWSITSQKSLESVVASVEANVGKPNMTDVGARIARRKRLRKSKTLLAADGDKR